MIVVEFEVVFGYPVPKPPPSALVDNTLKVLKSSLGFTATLSSTGKNLKKAKDNQIIKLEESR